MKKSKIIQQFQFFNIFKKQNYNLFVNLKENTTMNQLLY